MEFYSLILCIVAWCKYHSLFPSADEIKMKKNESIDKHVIGRWKDQENDDGRGEKKH